ncbi:MULTISPECIES: NB-ARC domain-containing protein [Sorangium]|uniref:NB-ARC domain-containing protein n=1 Tax=Sorangium TaxID=39643 RepID=UPI003D9C54DE
MLELSQPRVAPIAILGPAGIGKSTLARAALHDGRVVARYGERRYLARLDAAVSADAALSAIADALAVSLGPDLWRGIHDALRSAPAMLVLDDAESPWEHDRERMETLLGKLASISGVALVASIRGAERPGGVAWRDAIRVKPLADAPAVDLFCSIAGEEHRNSELLADLLAAQEGVPLAIALLGHLTEGASVATVSAMWQEQRTALLARPGRKHKLTHWGVSLELSIRSPRMTTKARRLLRLLAALPDGIAEEDLDEFLPRKGRRAAQVLGQVGLTRFEGGRVLMLAPVREYVRDEHPVDAEGLENAIKHYRNLAQRSGSQVGSALGEKAVARLLHEMANVDMAIRSSLSGPRPRPMRIAAIDAAIRLSQFAQFSGRTSPSPLEAARKAANALGDERREAACTIALAYQCRLSSQLEEAGKLFRAGAALARRTKEVIWEGNCLIELGNIAVLQARFKTAMSQYQEARVLFARADRKGGPPQVGYLLREVDEDDPDDEQVTSQLEEAKKSGDVLGQAECFQRIGNAAKGKAQLAKAEEAYMEALRLLRQAGWLLGVANCLVKLAETRFAQRRLELAREDAGAALLLYGPADHLPGQARSHHVLGMIARKVGEHAAARAHYTAALRCWTEIGNPLEVSHQHRHLLRLASGPREMLHHLVQMCVTVTQKTSDELSPYTRHMLRKMARRTARTVLWMGAVAVVAVAIVLLVLLLR